MTPEQGKSSVSRGEAIFRRSVGARANLYVVFDGARAPEGPSEAKRAGFRYQSLLTGELGERLGSVTPYLIEFNTRSSFAQWWFGQWGQSSGVLIESPASLQELRAHFRTLLVVRHTDRRKYYFRFYDPRVLRVFLPNCSADEVRRFFGPITAIYCEGEDGKELLTYIPDRTGVSVKRSPVVSPDRAP